LMLLLSITACLVADSEAVGISIGQYRHHGYGLKTRRPLRKFALRDKLHDRVLTYPCIGPQALMCKKALKRRMPKRGRKVENKRT